MKTCILSMLMVISASSAWSQNVFKAFIEEETTGERLVGAIAFVEGTTLGSSADSNGYIEITDIPDGVQTIVIRHVGYEAHHEVVEFPLRSSEPIVVSLAQSADEFEEILVSTTRSSRLITDEPTRMEAITAEELDEKSNMKPGDIRMVLMESTGIQTQQTSATTANAGIRIQGLDGRYTQILKDGFPLYSGFSGGLSIMQIPPLDLQQVEVIKGSASTLYGGGAIAGIINLISKVPSDSRELSVLLNGTSAGGIDISGFYGERFGDVAFTAFASSNSNPAYDPAGIDLTAIPKFHRLTFNPRAFFTITPQTELVLGVNTSFEKRLGGDMHYIRGNGDSTHSYFERNRSTRVSTQLAVRHSLEEGPTLGFKNSVSVFSRALETSSSTFDGRQLSTFSEATYSVPADAMEWIAGVNLWTDRFKENTTAATRRDYTHTVFGGFVQHLWHAGQWLSVESGLRADASRGYGWFLLPRASLLFKIAPNLTSRVGGGFGYKLPTIFTEAAEQVQFQGVLPIDERATKAERSIGGNADVNFRTTLWDALSFSINQMVFYTKLDDALVPVLQGVNMALTNGNGHVDTHGMETNIKLGLHDVKLLLGYTLTEAQQHFDGELTGVPLTPKHKVNAVLIFEQEQRWRAGLEAYYFSPQRLSDGNQGRDYWIFGFMVEKLWEAFSVYVNFENFSDTRQTRFGPIFSGSITNPVFKDIFAPVDGFVANGGIKLKL